MVAITEMKVDARSLTWQFIAGVYWLVIAFVLLTYGAVVPTALAAASLTIFITLPLAALLLGIPETARVLVLAAATILVVAAVWILQQSLPLPDAMLAQPIWSDVGTILATGVRATISVTPGDTMSGLLKLALPFAVFMSSLIIFDTDERALRALKGLAVGAGLLALFSIIQFLAVPDLLLFGEKRYYLDSLTGIFVNRNTAATFFGLAALLQLSLFWRTVSPMQSLGLLAWLEGKGGAREKRQTRNAMLYGMLALVCLTALLMTRSRAGVACAFLGMAVFVLLTTLAPSLRQSRARAGSRQQQSKLRRPLVALLLLAILTAGFAVLSGQLLLRAQMRSLQEDDRFCFMPGIFRAIEDSWPTGAGLTSFREWFPAYRDPSCGMRGILDKAHNFYLEGIFSTGMLFLPLCMLVILALMMVFGKGIRRRKRFRFAGILGIASLILVAAHGLVDFSLQIPGLAVYFAALAGSLCGICLRPSAAGLPTKDPSRIIPG